MDGLDLKIFRELAHDRARSPFQTDIRRSYATISTKLSIDEDTIRNRLDKLYQTGFLKGWRVLLNPNIVGLKISQVWVEIPPQVSKEDAIKRL